MKRICFTGKRPKDLFPTQKDRYDRSKYTKFIEMLSTYLISEITEDTAFISGGAQGFDQLAFWAVDLIKSRIDSKFSIKNIVYVPHKRQAERWASDNSLFSKTDYDNMLRQADSVKYIYGDLYTGLEISRALTERNHAMVNNSDLVIALYPDDGWKTSSGGTAECMRYAYNNNKPINQITYVINDAGELIPTDLLRIKPNDTTETLRACITTPQMND